MRGLDPATTKQKGSLESFLYGIARNLVRVARRLGPVEEAVDRAYEHDILGDLISNEATAALHRTLRELPERYRDVVVLCDLEERSYEDVARLIGRPVGTVRSRLHCARALLSAKLKRLNTPVGGVFEMTCAEWKVELGGMRAARQQRRDGCGTPDAPVQMQRMPGALGSGAPADESIWSHQKPDGGPPVA